MRFAFISFKLSFITSLKKNRIHFNKFEGVLISKGFIIGCFLLFTSTLAYNQGWKGLIIGGTYNRQFLAFFEVNLFN